MSDPIRITSVIESWHAPGYRDPELRLVTATHGEINVRLSPQAFVEMLNALCPQQRCIDDNQHLPLDWEQYRWNTTHVSQLRHAGVHDPRNPALSLKEAEEAEVAA